VVTGADNCDPCKSEDEGIRDNAGTCECMIDAGFHETATDPVQCVGTKSLVSSFRLL
jgi:hypothetical protein